MRINEQNLDSLRQKIRDLQEENKKLKEQLKNAKIPYEEIKEQKEVFQDYEYDQGSRIHNPVLTKELVRAFYQLFQGREDVFSRRGNKGGYFPQCFNRFSKNNICPRQRGEKQECSFCPVKNYVPYTEDVVYKHLIGHDNGYLYVAGIYPLTKNNTCRFIAFDFDNHEGEKASENDFANPNEEWKEEVDALRRMCKENDIDVLIERSRSGKGAHAWIFFNEWISASLARDFGFLLLDKGAMSVNLKTFQYYDRMFPNQDTNNGFGNTIALPLQGEALKEGNSAFVDENWNAYSNQWEALFQHTRSLSKKNIMDFMQIWQRELAEKNLSYSNRAKPWKKDIVFHKEDVIGRLHIVLSDGIYVDTLNLMPRIQNQIRSLAAFDNPVFYKNKNLGLSNWNQYTAIYLGKDINDYIKLPRGLFEKLLIKCEEGCIDFEIEDQREKGRPIHVSFKGELRDTQKEAIQELLKYDSGVLNAATSFGKTVTCANLIAQRKVNTLILMNSVSLVNQWVEELHTFLEIDEPLPTYKTEKGNTRKRKDVIGQLHGGKNTLTGIIDVASVSSILSKGQDYLNTYGMILVDECHHTASSTYQEVFQKVNAKYIYGVSANDTRNDKLEPITYMLLGPIRHQYTSKQRNDSQNIEHFIYPRYTRVVDLENSRENLNAAYSLVYKNQLRNEMIIKDIKDCVERKRTPVVLTKFKEHAKALKESIQKEGIANTFLLYGDNTNKENNLIIQAMKKVPLEEPLVLVATGQKIGEGFNFPRLDTLMLATPISAPQLTDQYLGRISRDFNGKTSAIVYDYIDSHIRFFDHMYRKRLRAYKKIGFKVIANPIVDKQQVNYIYSAYDYMDVFEQDLFEASSRIIVCSPMLTGEKVERFIKIVGWKQETGIPITVVTMSGVEMKYENPEYVSYLIKRLKESGIYVEIRDSVEEHFAIIDDEIVWHGGMNILGKVDIYDNLIRICSKEVASELMEIELCG